MCQNDTNSARYMRATGKEGERGKEKRTHTMGVRMKNGVMEGYAQDSHPSAHCPRTDVFLCLAKGNPHTNDLLCVALIRLCIPASLYLL